MTKDLTVQTQHLDIAQVAERTKTLQAVMEKVMKEDEHYGIIPGCKKPSLFKSGAEKIAVTFQLAIDSEVEDLSTGDEIRYRVKATARNLSEQFLGSSFGECSSNEKKYKWRKVYKEEFEAADEDRRREVIKGKKNGGTYTVFQVRNELADVANTILQMADKRAYVSVVRKVTAASDVFTQDLETLTDLADSLEEENLTPSEIETPAGDAAPAKKEAPPATKPAETKTAPAAEASGDAPAGEEGFLKPGPLKLIKVKAAQAKVEEAVICEAFKVDALEKLPMNKINDIFAWITEHKK